MALWELAAGRAAEWDDAGIGDVEHGGDKYSDESGEFHS